MADKQWRFENDSMDNETSGGILAAIFGGLALIALLSVCAVCLPGGGDDEPKRTVRPPSAEEIAQARIDAQFSAWDGSHRNLVAVVKRAMNDPGSFEHIETQTMKGINFPKTFIVSMEYSGKNAFGGRVRNTVVCEVSGENGDIVAVLSE